MYVEGTHRVILVAPGWSVDVGVGVGVGGVRERSQQTTGPIFAGRLAAPAAGSSRVPARCPGAGLNVRSKPGGGEELALVYFKSNTH